MTGVAAPASQHAASQLKEAHARSTQAGRGTVTEGANVGAGVGSRFRSTVTVYEAQAGPASRS
eukprot:252115-Rhodomonas_salina.3